MKLSNALPWATIGLYVLVIVYAVVGAVEVIRGQLDFEDYGKYLTGFAVAFGLLGIGRGVAAQKTGPTVVVNDKPAASAKRTTAKP